MSACAAPALSEYLDSGSLRHLLESVNPVLKEPVHRSRNVGMSALPFGKLMTD